MRRSPKAKRAARRFLLCPPKRTKDRDINYNSKSQEIIHNKENVQTRIDLCDIMN